MAVSPGSADEAGNPLVKAAARGDAARLAQLLAALPHLVDVPSPEGATPLMVAASAGHTREVEVLLSAGANPNRRGGRRAECPLLLAARKGHEAVVRALLFKGAHAAAVDDRGWTALHCAAFSGHTAVALALLTASPQPALLEARTSRGETPLALAAFARREDTVRLLLARGAQPSFIDDPRDMAFAEEMGVALRYTSSCERTCEGGSKSPSRVGSFGLSSILGMLRPGGSGNARTVFALPQPEGGRRWTEASGSGSRNGADRCATSQPVTARAAGGDTSRGGRAAGAGRPATALLRPLGRSTSGPGGGSGRASATPAQGSPSGEAPKQQQQQQQVSPRANSNARRRPVSAVPSAPPRYMAALTSKAPARDAKTPGPVHTHPAWAPDPRSPGPRAPASTASTPAPETAPAAPEPDDMWRLHELSYRGTPLLHHRRTNLLYTSVSEDSYPHVVGLMENGAPRWLDPGERQGPGQGRDEGRGRAQRQGQAQGSAAGAPPLAALAAQAQAVASLAATCPAAALLRRVGMSDEVVVRAVVGLGVHQVSELRALAKLDPDGPSWAPGRLGIGAMQRAELQGLLRRHLLEGQEGGGQGVEEQRDDGEVTAGPLDPSLSGLTLTQHVLERYGLAKLMVQVAEQQLHEPSSLTCLWDLGGLTPWEEARLGAMLRDLPALLEAQRAGDGGEGIAAANGEGQEADAEEADQDPEVVAGLGNKVFSNLYTVTSEPVSP